MLKNFRPLKKYPTCDTVPLNRKKPKIQAGIPASHHFPGNWSRQQIIHFWNGDLKFFLVGTAFTLLLHSKKTAEKCIRYEGIKWVLCIRFELVSKGLIISIIKLHYLTLCKYLCTSKYIKVQYSEQNNNEDSKY